MDILRDIDTSPQLFLSPRDVDVVLAGNELERDHGELPLEKVAADNPDRLVFADELMGELAARRRLFANFSGAIALGDIEPIYFANNWGEGVVQQIGARALRRYGAVRESEDQAAIDDSWRLLVDCARIMKIINGIMEQVAAGATGIDNLPGSIEIVGELPPVAAQEAEPPLPSKTD